MAYRREIVHPPLKIDLEPLAMKCAESKANPEANSGRKPQPKKFTVLPPSPSSQITPKYTYELFFCEMELETAELLSKEVTTRLFELYKVGVEHYNIKQDALKEGYFKRKLDLLANHPSVLGMLHMQKEHDDDNFYKKRQMERLLELNNHTIESAETLIKRIESAEMSNKLTVEKHLEKQMDDIKKRIEKRRIASRANSVNENQQKQDPDTEPDQKKAKKPKLNASLGGKRAYRSFADAEPIVTHESINKYFVEGGFQEHT